MNGTMPFHIHCTPEANNYVQELLMLIPANIYKPQRTLIATKKNLGEKIFRRRFLPLIVLVKNRPGHFFYFLCLRCLCGSKWAKEIFAKEIFASKSRQLFVD